MVDICRYELPTNLQNFAKRLNRSENIPNFFWWAAFLNTV